MPACTSTPCTPSSQPGDYQTSCISGNGEDISETLCLNPSQTSPPADHQPEAERRAPLHVADEVECSSPASIETSSHSSTSITKSPSTTHSSPTTSNEFVNDTLQSVSATPLPHPEDNYAPFNPVSKRTAELSESRRSSQRRMSQPPSSPSTLSTRTSAKKRGSVNQAGLQHIDENEPVEFHSSSNTHRMTRGRSHEGISRIRSHRRPQMTQRKSTSTLHVAVHGTSKAKDNGTGLPPPQMEVELEKKAAIVAATAAAWAVKENRAHANAGSDKRFNLQVRGGPGPSFDIIQSSVNPSASSTSSLCNQKRVVRQQPRLHPVMSTTQSSLETSSDDARDWSSGRFSLDGDFCLAGCCPGVAYARNKSRLAHLEEKNIPHPGVIATSADITTGKPELKSFSHPLSWASCLAYTFLSPLCLSSYLQHRHRAKTRRRYDVGGDECTDCISSLFCGPCELARESREIAHEEDSLADEMDRLGAAKSRVVAENCPRLPPKCVERRV